MPVRGLQGSYLGGLDLSRGRVPETSGDFNTSYKTGDTINFGGWAYVCITDASNGQSPFSHSAKWTVINEGFKYRGEYSNVFTYYKGDVVSRASSSYVAIAHNILNITPGTDALRWSILAE